MSNMIDAAKDLRERAKQKATAEGKKWHEAAVRRGLYAEVAEETDNPEGFVRILLNWDRAARDAQPESTASGDGEVRAETDSANHDNSSELARQQKPSERYSAEELRARVLRWQEQAHRYQQKLAKKAEAPEAKRSLWQTRIENAGRKVRHYERRLERLASRAA